MSTNFLRMSLISLAIAFAIALGVGLLPATAHAEENNVVYVGGVELTADAPYLATGAAEAQVGKPQGGYAHWNASSRTLTLSNYSYSGSGYDTGSKMVGSENITAAIYADNLMAGFTNHKSLTINLEGENNLSNTDKWDDGKYATGITAQYGTLEIGGNGSLAISAREGMYLQRINTRIMGADITITPTAETAPRSRGIFATNSNLTISDGASVSITMGSSTTWIVEGLSFSVNGGEDRFLTVTDGAQLNIIGGSEPTARGAVGISAMSTGSADVLIKISDGAKVDITSKDTVSDDGYHESSYGIYSPDGGSTTSSKISLTVKNAQLTSTAGSTKGTTDVSRGICLFGDVSILGSASVAVKGAEGGSSEAIYVNGDLTVSGTDEGEPTVTAIAGTSTSTNLGANTNGICVVKGDITLSDGTITAIGGKSLNGRSIGISCHGGNITLGAAVVNAIGGETPNQTGSASSQGLEVLADATDGSGGKTIIKPAAGGVISVLSGGKDECCASMPCVGSPISLESELDGTSFGEKWKYFLSYPGTHSHELDYVCQDDTGHKQECSVLSCPDYNKGKTILAEHVFDGDTDNTCDTCGYSRPINDGGTGGTEPESEPSASGNNPGTTLAATGDSTGALLWVATTIAALAACAGVCAHRASICQTLTTRCDRMKS